MKELERSIKIIRLLTEALAAPARVGPWMQHKTIYIDQ